MLALIYLAVLIILGDSLWRRFDTYISLPQRFSVAFITGLIISSWITYLCALLFANTLQPLFWGNLLFFPIAIAFIFWTRHLSRKKAKEKTLLEQLAETDKWDLVVIGLFTVFSGWMMFTSLSMSAGNIYIANYYWSDFGPNSAIIQNFALGHNFPTEYPHYAGERILYHFLFYFQAGNLEYLGLNLAWSLNLLSVLSLVSMLILVMTLGNVLFRSSVVGRIGAALFFFHGSLSYIPFLRSQQSISDTFNVILKMREFLPSGFTYRGETLGIWSQVVFINQRHFTSSISILLIAIIFLLRRYRVALQLEDSETLNQEKAFEDERKAEKDESSNLTVNSLKGNFRNADGFVFTGLLLGLLPMWNGAVFVAALSILTFLFFLFPLRKQMLLLALTSGLVALPQVLYLKTGHVRSVSASLFHWGYTIDNPTIPNVLQYLSFTFGFKLLLLGVALFFATWFQRRVVFAVTSLIGLAFFFRFSIEMLVNHKFLNIWLIIVNLFVAFGFWKLWQLVVMRSTLMSKFVALTLVIGIIFGGIVDLFPIYNGDRYEVTIEKDQLVDWITTQTDPKAIFLSDRFAVHRILLAGRRLFYGWPYYAWSAGYLTQQRDVIYKRMLEEQNPQALWQLLHDNNISYVAIDDSLRQSKEIKIQNEHIYEKYFVKVFRDEKSRYGKLSIFKVPTESDIFLTEQNLPGDSNPSSEESNIPAKNAFKGGRGNGRGEFEKPRGIALDSVGNIYIADTDNSRVQKFSASGEFIRSIGKSGTGTGELREPNGIAVNRAGDIYVTDASNHLLIKFKADGSFERQWSGPAPGFYGPRDVEIDSSGNVYVIDQGRARVVKLDSEGKLLKEWGHQGTQEGEFGDATGLAVTDDRVYVAEAYNARIQVFDLDGKFINQWSVPEWQNNAWKAPGLAFDSQTKRLYATSTNTNEVIVFEAEGKRLDSLTPISPLKLDNPSAIVLSNINGKKNLYVLNMNNARITLISL